uniref:T-complex 11 like 1 n=1 Tax=Rousettus aegyptiacus TaxID=9407 RepID=A0A7J8H7I5_ROUAE|nr:t-complex 11 like 1 [Rousettus aegyptiacus]
MSDNFDKSNINEAEKSKSNDSEQSLEDAAEGSDEALQKKIKSGSPSTQRVQRPHSLFTIAKIWKQPKCSSMDEWIKKTWYICIMEFNSVIKKVKS